MTKARLQLYLLRHADAGDPVAWEGDDADRPISAKGIRQADRVAAFLARSGFRPEVTLSSPKLRARQTAEAVASVLGGEVTLDDRLGSGFGLEDLNALLDEIGGPGRDGHAGPRRIVLVGHDPDFSALLSELCDAGSTPMPKGALARIDLDRRPEPGAGTLRWLIPPDALKRGD
jgi:phosphohistidine phosphatase